MKPLISIIIPAYNRQKFIAACINSALTQTYEYIEVIVVDDASTDNTVSIARSFENDGRLKVLPQEQQGGVARARNIGIDNANGEWIFFLDSDDTMPNNAVEILVNGICDEADWVRGSIFIDRGYKQESYDHKNELVTEYREVGKSLVYINCVLGSLYKMSVLNGKDVRFNEGINFAEDYIFNLKYLNVIENGVKNISEYTYLVNNKFRVSLSTRYHDNMNEAHKAMYEEEINLYYNYAGLKPDKRQYKFLDDVVIDSIRYYTISLKCDEACEKFRETFEMFAPYIENTEGYSLPENIAGYYKNGDYKGLYDFMSKDKGVVKNKIKDKIKKVLYKLF